MTCRHRESDPLSASWSARRAEHPSTPDIIANVMREAIISGALPGGVQLRQSELAAEFGVSVIPVREALRQVVAEGFVILQRNRGAIVAEVSIDEIRRSFSTFASRWRRC